VVLFVSFASSAAMAVDLPAHFLAKTTHHTLIGSMVPDNGDQNPYAIVVAPVSAGKIQKGDVLVDNFNNSQNLQGTGSTIMDYSPATQKISQFALIPKQLSGCPGGVGLSTAMTILKSGWVIVGSTPSTDGTANTKGQGCLIVIDSEGNFAGTLAGANINGPWGNMAVIDNGATATIFVSNAGYGINSVNPTGSSPVIQQATVLRIDLIIASGKAPVITQQTVIASGLNEQADASVFLIGPTGLALGPDGTLYISDSVQNQIITIANATTRTTSDSGKVLTHDGLLARPLALVMTPNGHLLTTNGLNGDVVEIDSLTGEQLASQHLDTDEAQSPPGSGDLFGIAMNLTGDGFYYVEDDMNTLMEAGQ
jgi:hypothetical protein